jgi:DNA replication protein DnaC
MLNEATTAHLHSMRLSAMAEAFRRQTDDPSMREQPFETRFGLMVDAEWNSRQNNKLSRLISGAHFPLGGACIEDIEYRSDRKLDKAKILEFSACDYIADRHNIIILGSTGAGKTFLGCALGMSACRNFYSVRYVRLPDLLDELEMARGEGIFKKTVISYKKTSLLILDDWLLTPLKKTESHDLLEIAEGRYRTGSTIFLSQFEIAGWHTRIGESTLSDAILDRIVHDSHVIFIDGEESMRKLKGLKRN